MLQMAHSIWPMWRISFLGVIQPLRESWWADTYVLEVCTSTGVFLTVSGFRHERSSAQYMVQVTLLVEITWLNLVGSLSILGTLDGISWQGTVHTLHTYILQITPRSPTSMILRCCTWEQGEIGGRNACCLKYPSVPCHDALNYILYGLKEY